MKISLADNFHQQSTMLCGSTPKTISFLSWFAFDTTIHRGGIAIFLLHPRPAASLPLSQLQLIDITLLPWAFYIAIMKCPTPGTGMERNVSRRRSGRVKWKLLPRFSKKRHQIDDDGYGGWSRVVLRACLPISLAAAGVENFLFLSNLHLFL